MRKIKKVVSIVEREKERNLEKIERLNLSYLDFIKEIDNLNLEIGEEKREDIIKLYENLVNLKFNNIRRIDFRVKREELREDLKNELILRELDINKFFELSKKIVILSREKENSNYLSIKV